MKLRQKSKRDQALDAAASVAKTWSEWRLGEKVTKTAAKATKRAAKNTSSSSSVAVVKRKPLRIAGAIALLGGIGAAVAKKLGGGKAEPLYTPPGPAPDMPAPPPSPVAVGDLAGDTPAKPTTPVEPTIEPAHTASTEVPPQDPSPVVVEDLVREGPGDTEAEPEAGAAETPAETATEEPAAASLGEDRPPTAELAPDPQDSALAPESQDADVTPEPEDLISDTADAADAADDDAGADEPSDRPAQPSDS
jgi:hypothetical protein